MLNQAEIQKIEEELTVAGKSVAELCRVAEIAETTWGRWKRGEFHPSYRKAQAVKDALNQVVNSSSEGAAQ